MSGGAVCGDASTVDALRAFGRERLAAARAAVSEWKARRAAAEVEAEKYEHALEVLSELCGEDWAP